MFWNVKIIRYFPVNFVNFITEAFIQELSSGGSLIWGFGSSLSIVIMLVLFVGVISTSGKVRGLLFTKLGELVSVVFLWIKLIIPVCTRFPGDLLVPAINKHK